MWESSPAGRIESQEFDRNLWIIGTILDNLDKLDFYWPIATQAIQAV